MVKMVISMGISMVNGDLMAMNGGYEKASSEFHGD